MMHTNLVDKEKRKLTHSQWQELMAKDAYRVLRQYESDRVHVEANWHGTVDAKAPAPYWTPFGLTVHNILPDGNRVPDPVECKLFKTEREAIDAYEKFLVKWSECERDMEGKFIEVGNKIAPPSEVEVLAEKLKDSDISDEFGSW